MVNSEVFTNYLLQFLVTKEKKRTSMYNIKLRKTVQQTFHLSTKLITLTPNGNMLLILMLKGHKTKSDRQLEKHRISA